MLSKRIIPCLDVHNRKVTKGVKFQNNVEMGDPVELAARYYDEGCDELVVYDITASAERRPIDIDMVREVACAVRIPFAVGGGISSLDDMSRANSRRGPDVPAHLRDLVRILFGTEHPDLSWN